MKSQSQPLVKPSKHLEPRVSVPYSRQNIDSGDVKAVSEALQSELITQGPLVGAFEEMLTRYTSERYAVAVANGTAALHLACLAAGVCSGDEVITTPITFAASANCVLYCGGTPVLADINPDTFCIDPVQIKKKITKKTKAIIAVDFGGLPADLQAVKQIAEDHGLTVIEDAAHSLGAAYQNKKIGSVSHMSVFSFHPVKTITTGEGGAVLTSRRDAYELMQQFRHHGIVKGNRVENKKLAEDPTYYEIQNLGFNYRITDIQCALGISQMKKIERFVTARKQIAERYREAFENVRNISLQQIPEGSESAHHLFPVQIDFPKIGISRTEFSKALLAKGIRVQVHYIPLHYHPYYQKKLGWKKGAFPVSERYYERAISLPIYPDLTSDEQERVIREVLELARS